MTEEEVLGFELAALIIVHGFGVRINDVADDLCEKSVIGFIDHIMHVTVGCGIGVFPVHSGEDFFGVETIDLVVADHFQELG